MGRGARRRARLEARAREQWMPMLRLPSVIGCIARTLRGAEPTSANLEGAIAELMGPRGLLIFQRSTSTPVRMAADVRKLKWAMSALRWAAGRFGA